MTQHIVQVVDAESFSAAASVSRETMSALLTYETLLRKWQVSINLVARSTLDDLWSRHFWDSAQLAALAPPAARRWLDLGSGGGFPGLVVAILLREREGFSMRLVESDQRKCAFLREIIRQTGAPAEVHNVRIEDLELPADWAPEVISARALASLADLVSLASPFWGKTTIGLFMKGKGASAELTEAAKGWIFESEAIASRSDPSGTVLKLWGLRHADH
jgi:16S rRNA (guanine527-N7)-methyltransferase